MNKNGYILDAEGNAIPLRDPQAMQRGETAVLALDSNKLGGKAPQYYIQPRNLLDNSDFRNPVNQRGQTSYTNSYGIDRWRTWDGHTITVNNGYVSLDGSMYQYIELSKVKNTDYTLAVCHTDGNIVCLTHNPQNAYIWNAGIGLGSDGTGVAIISIDAGDHLWACLYEGEYTAETLPPYVPKGYAVELAECLRYYADAGRFYSKAYNKYTLYNASVQAPLPMRTTPSVIVRSPSTNADNAIYQSGVGDITNFTVTPDTNRGAFIGSPDGGFVANEEYTWYAIFNADL